MWAYIQRSVRIGCKSTSLQVKKLEFLSDIQMELGFEEPCQWVRDLAKRMIEEEKAGNLLVVLSCYRDKAVNINFRRIPVNTLFTE